MEYERFIERRETLEANLLKAYALIYDTYCNKTMQNRIEESTDFETKIRDNPIELLKTIKIVMHDPARAKYPYASLSKHFVDLVNMRQNENESLIDYVKRFKQARDIVVSHIGKEALDTFMENTHEYRKESDDAKKKKLKEGAFERWMAYLLLFNSDQTKYGELTQGMKSQYSMNNDQYPKTIQAGSDIPSQHKFDKYKNRGGSKDHARRSQKGIQVRMMIDQPHQCQLP